MSEKRRILLVDGSNLLFQMFFGMPARIKDANGIGIWGVLGFVGALLKIFRYTKPTHVAVLFDGEHENPRNKIYAGYKSNRVDYQYVSEEDNPYSQLPWVYASLYYLGIAYKETIDCEADDWIAGYVSRYGVEDEI
ncbi:MAG: flap endonuclease, partial [Acutalibacter sp.]|nr:flap endonuclease [Acutalibacter sp.]